MPKIIALLIIINFTRLIGDVPNPNFRAPRIPYFMEPFHFQTVQQKIFTPDIDGMFPDAYGDLSWNPAFILAAPRDAFYLDFNYQPAEASSTKGYNLGYDTEYSLVIPRWYTNTSIKSVQTIPLYQLAFLKQLSNRLSVGLFNRSIFDYGPYRTTRYWKSGLRYEDALTMGFAEYDYDFSEMEPKALEVDDNQQLVWGNQSELYLGYQLTSNLDLGFRIGYYHYKHNGTLYDSKWADRPHDSFADLNDEELEISADHFEAGAGLIYHLNATTKLGVFASLMKGKSSETIDSQDTSDYWWEKESNPTYYTLHQDEMIRGDDYESSAQRPSLSLSLENFYSDNLRIRAFLNINQTGYDLTGESVSMDTSCGDRVYNYWDNDQEQFHLRREETSGKTDYDLTGSGTREIYSQKGLLSIIYTNGNNWTFFGGVYLLHQNSEKKMEQNSDYDYDYLAEYTLYHPETRRTHDIDEKCYRYKNNIISWQARFPVGIRVNLVPHFSIMLGTELALRVDDTKTSGDLVYPQKIHRRWKNETIIVEDIEIDRYERFRSYPPKTFEKNTAVHFGALYTHPQGFNFFIKTEGDIFQTNNWTLGFEKLF